MGGSFAGVVDEEDGGVKLALERAQEGEQGLDSEPVSSIVEQLRTTGKLVFEGVGSSEQLKLLV